MSTIRHAPAQRCLFGALVLSATLAMLVHISALAQEAPAAKPPLEHWVGSGVISGHYENIDRAATGYLVNPEIADAIARLDYDLYVDAAEKVTGTVVVNWSGASQLPPGGQVCLVTGPSCAMGKDCTSALFPTSSAWKWNVTGMADSLPAGNVNLLLSQTVVPIAYPLLHFAGTCPNIPYSRWQANLLTKGYDTVLRGMSALLHRRTAFGKALLELDDTVVDPTNHLNYVVHRRIRLREVGAGPRLRLDKELLARSVFMDKVSVPNALTANLTWGTPAGGSTTWRLPSGQETTPISPETVIPRSVDVGAIGEGSRLVAVKATDSLDRSSIEETVALVVARYFSRCPSFTASKKGQVVTYRCEVKAPEPPFEARISQMPGIIPYLGGKPLGLGKVQFSAALELRSTGEGSLSGAGSTQFEAMGGDVTGQVTLRGDLMLEKEGVRFISGSIEIALSGTIQKTEPLLTAIPALKPPFEVARKIAPAAVAKLESIATATLAVEPSIATTFNLVNDPDPAKGWKFGPSTIAAGAGFKVYIKLAPVPDKLELTAGVGGGSTFTFQVPPSPSYLKGIEVKFLAYFTLKTWKYETTGEYVCTFEYPSSETNCGEAQAATPTAPIFTLIDRSYLNAPNYSKWVAQGTPPRGLIVENVGPLARPDSFYWNGSHHYVVWSYEATPSEKPGSNANNADEIAIVNLEQSATITGFTRMTDDDRSDWNPQVFVGGGAPPMVVWERFDTSAPGDFNANPAAFLSHVQVAASEFNPSVGAPTLTPVQISTSGSINHRPHFNARTSGQDYLAVWVNNASNLIEGDAAHPDRFLWSTYNRFSKAWTPPVQVAGTIPGGTILSFDLATGHDNISNATVTALIFTADMDGNFATTNDVEVHYALYTQPNGITPPVWTPIQRLTNNAVPESDVVVGWVGGYTTPMKPYLLWRQGDRIVYLPASYGGTTLGGTPQTLGLTLPDSAGRLKLAVRAIDEALMLSWTQADGIATIRLLKGWTAWSQPRVDMPAPGLATPIDFEPELLASGAGPVLFYPALVENDTLITRTIGSDVFANVPVATTRDLYAIASPTLPLSPSIAAGDIDIAVTEASASSPDAATVRALVRNRGDIAADNLNVRLVRITGGPNVDTLASVTVTVPGNGSLLVTLPIASNAGANGSLGLKLSRKFCYAPSSCQTTNFGSVTLLPADAVAVGGGAGVYTPNATVAHAWFAQAGPIRYDAPFTATVRLGNGGPIVSTAGMRLPYTATTQIDVSAAVSPTVLGEGEHILYWTATSGDVKDPNPLNNTTTSLVVVEPDLIIDPNLTQLDGTAVKALVSNVGNWPSAATTLEVWTSPPGTTGAAKLGSVAVPALQAGAEVELAVSIGEAEAAALAATGSPAYLLLDPADKVHEIDENVNLIAIAGTESTVITPNTLYLPTIKR